ncbi:unnamed protein product [Cyprideis torosa]|uniref:Uncharacterized protein n=1 Tax=Cyprideis torosa TaxID=163714 RepID=A0A7R8ZPA7_9CRUS|nr:unnamed protein product [Cyprideis torosa]CAG0900092.1 unnamed protein product [Cyprideis torosa]
MVRRVVLPILAHFQEDLCGWTNRFLTSWQCSDPPLVESFHLASQAITTDSSSGPISSSEWESLLELLLEQAAELKKVHEKYSDVSMPKDDEEQAKSEEHGNAVHDEQRDEYILPTSGDECRGPPMETSEADGSVGYCFPETQITASSDALKAMNDCNSSEGILDSDGEKHSLSTSLSLTQNTISGMDLLEQAADALKSLKTINISDTLATPDFSPMPLGGGALQDLYTGHLSAVSSPI